MLEHNVDLKKCVDLVELVYDGESMMFLNRMDITPQEREEYIQRTFLEICNNDLYRNN